MRSAVVLSLLALLAAPAFGGPLVPTRASQVVVLSPTAVTDSACGTTAYPVDNMRTSTGDVVPFVIPPKQVFVVTSADVFGSASAASRNYRFSLTIESSPPIPGGALLIGAAPSDAAGYYAGSVTAPSGVIVPSGALLCAKIGGPNDEPTFMRVHGFFAKDK